MADLEFVIEAPHVTRTNKKRPRLVTSCDHCRVKKIKCIQQAASGKCEACVSANLPCLYRDREQYFSERTRMLSGAGSTLQDASTKTQNRAHLSTTTASTPASSRGPTPPYSSYEDAFGSPDPSPFAVSFRYGIDDRLFQDDDFNIVFDDPLSMRRNISFQSLPWLSAINIDMGAQLPQITSQPSPLLGLFDPSDRQQPHPNLMVSFLTLFFEKLGTSYCFLSSSSICERFIQKQLSPLLANAIAASAVRFSTVKEILQIGPANASDVYCQAAKSLLPSQGSHVTIETLHAVMLLAWAEQKRGRQAMFNDYARLAIQLAADIGISHESLPLLTQLSDPQISRVLQNTWEGIHLLERTLLAAELVALTSSSIGRHRSSPATDEPLL